MIACAVAALFVVALAAQVAGETRQVSGTVASICPQHRAIQVKHDHETLTLLVDEKADNASRIKQQIGQLKVNDSVTVSYTVKDGKNYITELKKSE
jgi:hypothetical protein